MGWSSEEWTEADEAEEYAARIGEVKDQLVKSLPEGVNAFPLEMEDDLLVHGPLSVILEWTQDWRAEIEELGNR